MFQRDSVKVLHHDERAPIVLPDFVNRADVRVVERGSGARLPAKTFQGLSILGYVVGQKLQRDGTAEIGIFGSIDHTHPATPDLFEDMIVRDGLVDHGANYGAGIRMERAGAAGSILGGEFARVKPLVFPRPGALGRGFLTLTWDSPDALSCRKNG